MKVFPISFVAAPDASMSASPLAPSHEPVGGGLAGWIAALAGIYPDHPDRWAPSPQAADIDNFAPNALAQSRLLRSR